MPVLLYGYKAWSLKLSDEEIQGFNNRPRREDNVSSELGSMGEGRLKEGGSGFDHWKGRVPALNTVTIRRTMKETKSLL